MSHTIPALALLGLLAGPITWAQTSPVNEAKVTIPNAQSADDMPLPDYLGLLRQIAPAAEEGAKDYLAAFKRRCGRALTTTELRRAISESGGDPILMGLIRASHLRDTATREQLAARIRCPGRRMP